MLTTIFIKLAEIMAADDLPIPNSENKTLWDLIVGPYTGLLGPFFFTIMIGLVTGLVWIKTQSFGPALSFFVVANGVFAAFLPESASMYFTMCAILGVVALFYKFSTR